MRVQGCSRFGRHPPTKRYDPHAHGATLPNLVATDPIATDRKHIASGEERLHACERRTNTAFPRCVTDTKQRRNETLTPLSGARSTQRGFRRDTRVQE